MVPPQVGAEPDRARGGAGSHDREIVLARGVPLRPEELTWRFSTSGGPGGQHVNTSNTRAEVSFDIEASAALPDWARTRLIRRLGRSVSVAASDTRSQARNRELALRRLADRLSEALHEERPRRPTRPTLASQRRRLEEKRRRGERKRERRDPPPDA